MCRVVFEPNITFGIYRMLLGDFVHPPAAKFSQAWLFLSVRQGFRLATLPHSPNIWREIVVTVHSQHFPFSAARWGARASWVKQRKVTLFSHASLLDGNYSSTGWIIRVIYWQSGLYFALKSQAAPLFPSSIGPARPSRYKWSSSFAPL